MRDSIDLVIPAYNVANIIGSTIDCISEQRVPDDWQFKVYVYNDGSTDDTEGVLDELRQRHHFLNIVGGGRNAGRSEARNRGIRAGKGRIVIMCDADCRYTRNDVILEFINELERGADAVIGMVEVAGGGFWARYTNSLIPERQETERQQGLVAFGTTQNIAVRRSILETMNGYSTDYRRYGFEDKDFLIRLERTASRVVIRPDLLVSHDDDFTLAGVCRKFTESGRYSACIFRRRHPVEYRKLPYFHCDATTSRIRRFLGLIAGPISAAMNRIAGISLSVPLAFPLQRLIVRMAICAAYLHGTALSERNKKSTDRE